MQKAFFYLILAALSGSCKGIFEIKESFTSTPSPAAPDYSKKENWASLPDKKDAADSVPLKSNLHDDQRSAIADVFFIYPTTYTYKPKNQYAWNADVNDHELNSKTQTIAILNQASIFNGSCRIYSPYYRQANLYAFYSKDPKNGEQALELAYNDVRSAFEYYLKNYNNGRPIIIASHSQGSYHGERLLKDYFNGKDLQKQLIEAYLIGRAIRPNAFSSINTTEKQDDLGTWASWNTYARDYYPDDYEKYFRGSQSTNPLLWNSGNDFASKELNHGGVALHFTFAPELVDAQNHEGMLWINKPHVKGRFFLHKKRWHIADMNFFYMNIRENVATRISAWQNKHK